MIFIVTTIFFNNCTEQRHCVIVIIPHTFGSFKVPDLNNSNNVGNRPLKQKLFQHMSQLKASNYFKQFDSMDNSCKPGP